ncbi:MAG: hypothetical protein ABW360_13035 [Phenylobacterium sp.]
MLRLKTFALATAFAALPLSGALAQTSPVAVGAQIGTPGVGGEAQLKLNDSFVVRGDVDYLSFKHDEDWSGVEYDGKVKAKTGGAFADWHPGGGSFLVSAGAYFGQRKVDFSGQPSGPVDIGGQTFTAAQVGRINGRAKLSKAQPFAGVGWDNTFGGGAWGFRALAGVAFSKEPSVSLTSDGTLAADPAFQARLRQEEADIADDAKNFKYYPVLQVGLTRRF